MPAIVRDLLRQAGLAVLAVALCGAQPPKLAARQDATPPAEPASPGLEVHQLVEQIHEFLITGNSQALCALFDPATPQYRKITSDITNLLREAIAPSTISFLNNTGDAQTRKLELDWRMKIRTYNGESATERRGHVSLTLVKQKDAWRVVALAPADLFAPIRTGAVWDLITDSLGALAEINGDLRRDNNNAVPTRFIAAFDPKMPGFDELRANVTALVHEGDVESYLELISDEGDDRGREVKLDWTLTVANPSTKIVFTRRRETVTCRLERQRGKWRIVALQPAAFLSPANPALVQPAAAPKK